MSLTGIRLCLQAVLEKKALHGTSSLEKPSLLFSVFVFLCNSLFMVEANSQSSEPQLISIKPSVQGRGQGDPAPSLVLTSSL